MASTLNHYFQFLSFDIHFNVFGAKIHSEENTQEPFSSIIDYHVEMSEMKKWQSSDDHVLSEKQWPKDEKERL